MMRRRAIIGRRIGSGTVITPPPAGGGLVFDSTLNFVLDGNSHIYGIGGAQNIPRVLAKTAPISVVTHPITVSYDATPLGGSPTNKWQSDKGIIVWNFGVSGESWRKMNGLDGGGGAALTDAAWVDGKVNVLLAWEGTNSLVSGRTPEWAISDATDYIAARRALHPGWKIIVGTVAPRQVSTQAGTDSLNASIDAYNTLLRAQYLSMGADVLFDVRAAGSQLNLPDYLNATFEAAAADASTTLWASGEVGGHTHFSSNGNVYIVNTFIMPALQSLPAG